MVRLKAHTAHNLTCRASGAKPAAEITWYRDGEVMEMAIYSKVRPESSEHGSARHRRHCRRPHRITKSTSGGKERRNAKQSRRERKTFLFRHFGFLRFLTPIFPPPSPLQVVGFHRLSPVPPPTSHTHTHILYICSHHSPPSRPRLQPPLTLRHPLPIFCPLMQRYYSQHNWSMPKLRQA